MADDIRCKNGFVINSTCYVAHNDEKVTWFTAVNRCHSKGGSLAVFDDNVREYINETLVPGERDHTHSSWIALVKPWWTWSGMFRF